MNRLSLHAVIALGALSAGGCTAAASDPENVIASREASLGILQIERVANGHDTSAQAELGAAFARYRGVGAMDVADLLGAHRGASVETCSDIRDDAANFAAPDATVDLVNIGPIDVTLGANATHLVPRTFPELARVAAGFFYAGDAELGAPIPEIDEYVFRAEGTPEIGAFEVAVASPDDLNDLRVDGQMPSDAVVVARGTSPVMTWNAGDPNDVVQIEARTSRVAFACSTKDSGTFTVPALWTQKLSGGETGTLVVRRLRTQAFDARGVDEAFVRLATTRNFSLIAR